MWDKFKKPVAHLDSVHYEIRGPLLLEANRLESLGHRILKLNIGNPAVFGFEVPEVLKSTLDQCIYKYHGYCDSKGHLDARKAIIDYNHKLGVGLEINDPNRVYVGNGVSELIILVTNALCDNGDEILVPSPDYPLWSAAVNLAGGKAVYYRCDPNNKWQPNVEDIESKITEKTKAIVLINPNNPTGQVYSKEVLEKIAELAVKHEIIILADEIYDRITYDQAQHIPIASLNKEALVITFNGASKANRLCGYRLGWMFLTGPFEQASGFVSSLDKLTSMRLCSVSPFQAIIRDCLEKDHSIEELTSPGGRLYEQRKLLVERINKIHGLSCEPVQGALYAFVKLDFTKLDFKDDVDFAQKLLSEEHVLVVHGQGFNWKEKDHFRIVFLPDVVQLEQAVDAIERLCNKYKKD
ncbi:aminotransferase class I/II-fold pyridoxal phosphate-dependent enzyme [Psittacicella gerlachiana]|uniref:alanine transaminase n=1 Tax=Psittacicella gerlachiana TaxID=2028574 RepID=A0A3A1YE58_9GAMM|nr:aminotransferase class I/II-fold pyridoxal phosphate-dependent enzyme [Psittacicella gerlachiana]RIY35841.1 aminotransferase [Psittacicella gerlachiana]